MLSQITLVEGRKLNRCKEVSIHKDTNTGLLIIEQAGVIVGHTHFALIKKAKLTETNEMNKPHFTITGYIQKMKIVDVATKVFKDRRKMEYVVYNPTATPKFKLVPTGENVETCPYLCIDKDGVLLARLK